MDIAAYCKLLLLHNICAGLPANNTIYNNCRLLRSPRYSENFRAKKAEAFANPKFDSQHWCTGRF